MTDQPVQASMQGVITDPDQIIGMELTRALNAGSPIKPNQLRAPKIITRGQQVILVSGTNGLEVRMQGKALKDAVAGERIKVTNLSSGQQIEGIANTDGTVSVP
jgi:flagella basal body P-ring formation protein FlgA